MNEALLQSFGQLQQRLIDQRGPLNLFALVEREDLPERWDLLIAAPWTKNRQQTVKFVVGEIQQLIGASVLTSLSRILLFDSNDPVVSGLASGITVEGGRANIRDCTFNGIAIKHGYIYTASQRGYPAK